MLIKKLLSLGIIILFLFGSFSPLVFGTNLETTIEESVVSDYEFASTSYTSDLTISETVVISDYLNPQPTMVVDTGLMDSPWPMKCHDLHHTSRSPYVADDGGGLEKWRFSCDWMESSAVIDNDGIIYFGDFDDYLYAIYPNGTLKWKYKTDMWIWSAPALADDGTIYVGSWDQKLYSLYPNGTRKWATNVGAVIQGSPAIAPDGVIYVSTMTEPPLGHSLIAINPNGTIRWRYLTGDDMTSDPAIGDDGTIYVGSLDTYFYAINPNGTLKWRFKTGDWVKAHPAIANDGTVYISSFDGWLYALNPVNGSLIWKYSGGGDEASPAIGPDGIIYLGNSRLRAIYPNGTLKYSVNLGPNIAHASPAISADGILYVAGGKVVVAVNAEDGAKIWQKQIADYYVDSSPVIGPNGTVYIGSTSEGWGYLHAFGPVTENNPPSAPTISGKTHGAAGERYWYRLTGYDPDRNPISFYIDWGDGNTTGWTLERASGELCYYDHTYEEQGTYTIQAKVRDVLGVESEWATLVVKMPVMHPYQYLGWQWLQQHFPLLSRLFNLLGGLL